jgi:hypothetical protein
VGDILREIDEELKQERYLQLWKKYRNHATAAAVVVILGLGAVYGWNQYQEGRRIEASNRYAEAQALAARGQTDEAAALFANLAEEGPDGYTVIARLRRAALRADKGDVAGAVAGYDAIAADTGVDREVRDLATLLAVLRGMELPGADAKALAARVEPLDTPRGAWRHSARELKAVLAQMSGDPTQAKKLYAELADDVEAPPGIRARAAEMLAVLGG